MERIHYLDLVCAGNAELRAAVDRLLEAHPLAANFLARPAVERHELALEDASETTQAFSLDAGQNTEYSDDACEDLCFLDPTSHPDALGKIGHYVVLEVLGRGGFGIVVRAFDETLQREVAVKVLSPSLAASAPARRRFLREARASARVRHENVVQVYQVDEQPLPHLVMEFIPGGTLQQRLDRAGPLSATEVAQIGRQIAEGLAAAHATGMIHRDIKPANILIEEGPTLHAKITDFGLARAADDASLTQSGIIAGTPIFMAPEQVQGEPFDHRADLFSLGSVLYTLCTGQAPFRANSTLAALKRVAEDVPQPIAESHPETPPWLCEIIAQLHSKQPEERIGTAREVADLLRRGLAELQHPGDEPWHPFPSPANQREGEGFVTPREGEAPAEPLREPARSVPNTQLAHAKPSRQAPPTEREPSPVAGPRGIRRRAAFVVAGVILLGCLGWLEATGTTQLASSVIRLFSPDGTLVVEIDDPDISVRIDDSEIVITGAGIRELRLRPGKYKVEARKEGQVVSRELINIARNGKEVVRISQEGVLEVAGVAALETPQKRRTQESRERPGTSTPTQNPTQDKELAKQSPEEEAWERSLAGLPAAEQVQRVAARLRERNRGFDGQVVPTIESEVVIGLKFLTDAVQDLSPVRGLKGLKSLECGGTYLGHAALADLSPLQGLSLTRLDCSNTQVSDLSPLKGMPLKHLHIDYTRVQSLAPVEGIPLEELGCASTQVADLSPLRGMPLKAMTMMNLPVQDIRPLQGLRLTSLDLYGTRGVTNIQPLRGMPLEYLNLSELPVTDLSVVQGMETLRYLCVEHTPLSDLTPLRGLKLVSLEIKGTRISELEAIRDMPLKRIRIDYQNQQLKLLRSLKDLTIINDQPVAQFWKETDGQE